MSARTWKFVVGVGVTAACAVTLVAGQQPAGTPGPFTAQQASAGRAAYLQNCASCHGDDLAGPPALAGRPFLNSWGPRSTRDLFGYVSTTMPPEAPGALQRDA